MSILQFLFRTNSNSRALSVVLIICVSLGFYGCGDEGDAEELGEAEEAAIEVPEGSVLYDLTTVMDQTVTMMGEAMSGQMRGEGTLLLTRLEENETGIVWQAKSNQNMTGEMAGQSLDSIPQEQVMTYTVSPDGDVVDIKIEGLDDKMAAGIQQVLQNASNRQNGMQMFLPDSWLGREVGEIWTDHIIDTIDVRELSLDENTGVKGDLFMVMDIPTEYTYEGEVDTLGIKGVRVSYTIENMTMHGSVTMHGSGVESERGVTFSNQSSGSGRFYYSVDDRLQIAGQSVTTARSLLEMPGVHDPIPMEQTITTVMARK